MVSPSIVETTDAGQQLELNHLIIVCCHAIYLGTPSPPSSTAENWTTTVYPQRCGLPSNDESNWLIEPFQKGETATYIGHVEAGVRALAADEHAILVFSGGATKPDKTAKTEGDGYLSVALENGLFGNPDATMLRRVFVDRFATDSYQNILMTLIQFPLFVQESLGSNNINKAGRALFPKKMTIVSHEFKRARFLDLHLPALHWHGETTFVGLNPPFDPVKMAQIEYGDKLRGYGAWEKDIYGVGADLAKKRTTRGWNEEKFKGAILSRLPTDSLKTELQDFVGLRDCGQNLAETYQARLPWE
ncbi:uncharacterized protein A1O9_00859 [Exophiala aquamarina CBS 119918]|uniref:DUF218 domain-containing protein n=1 Tax=Exophiala aquamarina CBS 119918 TaxID=1182545 RepID=A0A072Q4Q3_9EURO|nr:uncharacterized protein A1O9_00859 [Exophiala aquamarina CBS 119918]KEF62885.1 hypothetical protein A1O9_00859 [Exophiala aquamarina CBS 119918]